uniref:Mitochondrial NADH:ubiquinone oxidoreductase 19 kDa subunit-like protein n=1 Tax=Maconellicoccus hirsutus TaxID=177089 RepID=A2I474_MACHI|nr:mitochondrial NADH:ubiquinone oxidoreductase 19 kDa subunit-like protein [Maconellicoccus hirsutus]
MVVTYKVPLPTYEELDVEEVNLGGATLMAGSFHLGKYCEEQNDEFMLCRREEGRMKCFNEGKEVTACTLDFFRKVKKSCAAELQNFAYCIDQSSMMYDIYPCRKTQAVFDKCMLENMGIERPIYWYYSRPRVFDSKIRPKPEPEKPIEFPNPPVAPIPEEGLPDPIPGKMNSRYWWFG